MIHTAFFYIAVNFVFNLPDYVTSYMHHTGKKESKNRRFFKKAKNKVMKICPRSNVVSTIIYFF